MKFPTNCCECGAKLLYSYNNRVYLNLASLVVSPGEEDQVSWWCPKCEESARQAYVQKLERLARLRLSLGAIVELVKEESDVEEVSSARSWFRNKRSRKTHGDGMMHEYPFWTYGSCNCSMCCVQAMKLAKAEPGQRRALSWVFSETIINEEGWNDLLRHFSSLSEISEQELGAVAVAQ